MLWPVREDRAPALILCHGFGSCKENHAAFAAQALARGWAVLSFDFRGHGGSEGCAGLADDQRRWGGAGLAARTAGSGSGRIAVRGASMGGYFAIHAACRWPHLAACVALNPPDEASLSAMLGAARDPHTYFGQWRLRGEGFPRIMSCDFSCWLETSNLYGAVAAIAPRPLLLVHGTGDALVPPQISEDLYAAAEDPKTLWLLESADHCFASRDPEVCAHTLDWLGTL